MADAVVRNNIIFDSGTGLSLYGHTQVAQMKDVTALNNAIYNCNDGLFVRWGGTNMTLANNAVYCPGKTAINSSTGVSGNVRSNYVEGSMSGDSIDNSKFFAGGSHLSAFADPGMHDFWPTSGSALLNNANANYVPSNDFNKTLRTSPYDVGAYETEGLSTNPGWKIISGFKEDGGIDKTPPASPKNLRIQ